MSSATESFPRFGLGEWVSFPVGSRRGLARVVEDRGPVGPQGHRLYQLQLERGEDGGRTIEMPEADLKAAPTITTAAVARTNGLSTQNWPRQGFHVTYNRSKDGHVWTASLMPVLSQAVPPMEQGPGGWRYADDVNREIVRVDLEYDPRLDNPQNRSDIWENLEEEARKIGDAVFKAKHPKAKIIPST